MRPGDSLLDLAWIGSHLDDIAFRTTQHLAFAAISVLAGALIAFGLALAIRRFRPLHGPVTAVAGVIYTIPSLAMFAALVPFTGLSLLTAVIPLTLYSLQVLVRSFVAGLDAAAPDVLEAADGLGYSDPDRLRRVELPLAIPLVIAGIRLASVSTIGLVMIVSLIGNNFGGLGLFIREGLSSFFATKVYVGAGLSVTLAIIVDLILIRVERAATPWSRGGPSADGHVPDLAVG